MTATDPSGGEPAKQNRVLIALVAPFQTFFRLEAAGGLVMMACAVLALGWANSPFRAAYAAAFHTPAKLELAGHGIAWTLQHFTNDALMTLFFVVAGLEIKRELAVGELSTWRRAALPLVAALGGMLVPALIYLGFNPAGPARAGWGVPIATDIAFALGCLSLVRARAPASLFVFLTALAIFDDLGAIIVIALFYGGGIDPQLLGVAAILSSLLVVLGRAQVRAVWPYAALGTLLWVAVLNSGIHATLAGVVLGLSLPATPGKNPRLGSPLDRMMQVLHRPVAFVVVPLFALANAGVALGSVAAFGSSVTLGVLLGLCVGKPVGVLGATYLATRFGLAPRPTNATWSQLFAVSLFAGIGFTMSLLVGNLGLGSSRGLEDEAKIGVLAASLLCALLGLSVLWRVSPLARVSQTPPAERLS